MKQLIKKVGYNAAKAMTSVKAQAVTIGATALSFASQAHAAAPTDMDSLITWVSDNKTTVLGIGLALLAFGVGRRLLRKGGI